MKVLITGCAGFIGSHLMSACLHRGDNVVGYDNLLTGRMSNLAEVLAENPDFESRFVFLKEDIRDLAQLKRAASGCDLIFHEAAIGSVPWSISDPLLAHETNLTGFVNVLEAARSNGIKRIVYASSSAVYGNTPDCVAREGGEGQVLSPYASTKRAQEIYAESWSACYGLTIIGLRYFNVFGVRQDPNGAYAAVIPKWCMSMKAGQACSIYGTGDETRDYCHVSNVVEANLLAAACPFDGPRAMAFNIGCGVETSLKALHVMMSELVLEKYGVKVPAPVFCPPRQGDIARSCADVDQAREAFGYVARTSVAEGLAKYI